MSDILRDPVTDATAWRADSYPDPAAWTLTLTEGELAEIDAALVALKAAGKTLGFEKADFPLPTLANRLDDVYDEIQYGRGFQLIRGLKSERYTVDDLKMIFWGLGHYLGTGIVQNKQGELIGSVQDYGEAPKGTDPYLAGVRFYRTSLDLPPHTDSCDVVGLLCVRRAMKGGESAVVSSTAIYNEILKTRPHLIDVLCDGFHVDLGAKTGNLAEVTMQKIPVFSYYRGALSCKYNKRQLELGAEKSGHPLTADQQEAVDYVRELSMRDDLRILMDLQPGDIQILNNRTTMHAREQFDDFDEPDRKRLLLRIWLNTPEGRPVAPEMLNQLNTGARGGVRVEKS
jgi:hypothetical protein